MVGSSQEPGRFPVGLRPAFRRFGIQLLILVFVTAAVVWLISVYGPSILSWGERRAYEADRTTLAGAVMEYRVAPSALQPWPTISSLTGVPREGDIAGYQCDGSDRTEVCSWIDIGLLAENGLLRSAHLINSADSTLNVTATNAPSGNYGWFISGTGDVASVPEYAPDVGYP